MKKLGHFINGKFIDDDNRLFDVYNPATDKVTKQVALASKSTVVKAINFAEEASILLAQTSPGKRVKVLFRFRDLLVENGDEICRLISEEHGKVLSDAMGEVIRGVENVEYACGIPQLLKGEHSKNAGPEIDTWTEQFPLGVVAGITPFNFPVMVPLWMYASAIACGNAFILKPSEKDPSVNLFIAGLLKEAGLPDGVFTVINGDKEAVDTLLNDKRIQAVSFVGSTPVAEYIYATASANGKRVQALGGAKNHAIIMADADMDSAVNALMGAVYGSAGERCMAISAVICVGDSVADQLIEKMAPKVEALKIGPGTDSDNEMGPLVSKAHCSKVRSYVDLGVEEGAVLVVDGRTFENNSGGYYLGGTIFDKVTSQMRIHKEEIFGPVLVILRAPDLKTAVEIINNHEYGNGTCIFTGSGAAARYFTDKVQAGMVGVNVPLPVPVAYHSFGGWKRSLFGDNYAYGPDSIRFYTRKKTITQKWPAETMEKIQFSFPNH